MERITLIIGAMSPVGRVIAEHLALDGHLLALFDADPSMLEQVEADAETDGVMTAAVDLTDPDSVVEGLDSLVETFGIPNGMVLVLDEAVETRILDGGVEPVTAAVQQQILGPLSAVSLAVERMQNGGSILFVLPASSGPAAALATAVQGAITGFVRGAATELAGEGLRINAILAAPRPLARAPSGRAVTATELAAVVRLLMSDEAGPLTGQCVNVDGGVEAAPGA